MTAWEDLADNLFVLFRMSDSELLKWRDRAREVHEARPEDAVLLKLRRRVDSLIICRATAARKRDQYEREAANEQGGSVKHPDDTETGYGHPRDDWPAEQDIRELLGPRPYRLDLLKVPR